MKFVGHVFCIILLRSLHYGSSELNVDVDTGDYEQAVLISLGCCYMAMSLFR